MQKRGMELAVNTLVVLILGIVILVSGLAFMYSLFDDVKDLPAEVDRQTEEQLFNILLSSKKHIAALYNVQTVKWKESATFPIAIQNQLIGTKATFEVADIALTGEPGKGADHEDFCLLANGDINPTNADSCPRAAFLSDPFTLQRYDSHAFYALVDVPSGAPTGEYTFTITVASTACDSDAEIDDACPNPYAKTKIHVNVK
jgi:hypothetical protein